jgi:hypothetical protein
MKYIFLVLVISLTGCTNKTVLDLQPWLAVSGNYSLLVHELNFPDNPTGKCRNCNGTGKLSDGSVSVECPVCGGTGIEPSETLKHENTTIDLSTLPSSEPKTIETTVRSVLKCANGKCNLGR